MIQYLRRQWKYLTAKLTGRFEERADPKVQLQQAITEVNEQHKRLKEQAATVIANRTKTELQLNRTLEDLEKVNANAQQALVMADEASQAGDQAKAEEYTKAAETLATRLISLEAEVEDLKALHFEATESSEQAKAAVSQNRVALEQKLAEREKLLGQIDQAAMQEQMNEARRSLSETVGEDAPSIDEVRKKIETRYAKAMGMAELTEDSVETRMIEVEQATRNTEANARLDSMRANLGIGPGSYEDAVPVADEPAAVEAEGDPSEA
jgi:phage shock protein A